MRCVCVCVRARGWEVVMNGLKYGCAVLQRGRCVCVCVQSYREVSVCVCVGSTTERERGVGCVSAVLQRERVCVCVCVFVRVGESMDSPCVQTLPLHGEISAKVFDQKPF